MLIAAAGNCFLGVAKTTPHGPVLVALLAVWAIALFATLGYLESRLGAQHEHLFLEMHVHKSQGQGNHLPNEAKQGVEKGGEERLAIARAVEEDGGVMGARGPAAGPAQAAAATTADAAERRSITRTLALQTLLQTILVLTIIALLCLSALA